MGAIGAKEHSASLYEHMRPYAGTAIVIRAPAAACYGPADQYLGLLASAMGDQALAEVHFEAALRLARRMRSAPFIAAAEVELARTLRRGHREGDEERIAAVVAQCRGRSRRMGLTRIARMAAEPGLRWAAGETVPSEADWSGRRHSVEVTCRGRRGGSRRRHSLR